MISVEIRFVDGGYQEFTQPDSIVGRLRNLQSSGIAGKELVHSLLTDDWGPPPSTVRLVGTLGDGTRVDETIVYQ